ncbi:MAG: phosphoribosylanthranilate isomerase [Pseudobutyrivibrio sp.]|nr:phosphoribosylanthranilate isomerase [Pseudobutyrivibrio sp.]
MSVNESHPDYAGFVIDFPRSHRNITKVKLRALKLGLSKEIKAVGVLVDKPEDEVAKLISEGLIDIPQLHGHEDNSYIKTLKSLIPEGIPVWQAIQVKTSEDVKKANESLADYVILDAGQGTGKTFDWSLLDGVKRAYGLAGGINLDNLNEAMNTGATMLDISGGVETDKVKDEEKIRQIIKKIKEAE